MGMGRTEATCWCGCICVSLQERRGRILGRGGRTNTAREAGEATCRCGCAGMLVSLLPKVVAALLLKWQTGETYESRQEIRGSHLSAQLFTHHQPSNPHHHGIQRNVRNPPGNPGNGAEGRGPAGRLAIHMSDALTCMTDGDVRSPGMGATGVPGA
jgi:hypothetical protein